MKTKNLKRKRLLEVLHYDPSTGVFTWKKALSSKRKAGERAGNISKHCQTLYRKIRIDGVLYFEHRLAWLYMRGRWPHPEVDHRDGDGQNNAWSNLRIARRSDNMANRAPSAVNKSGVKGVYQRSDTGKWCARIQRDKTAHNLGCFSDLQDAKAAYEAASKMLFGEFARSL